MRLAVRTPYAGSALLGFLATRAIPGVEAAGDGWYARTLALPHGTGTVRLEVARRRRAGGDRVRHRDVRARRPARHRRRRRAGPPDARRRLRPGRRGRRVRRRPGDRAARAPDARAAGARPRRRPRDRGPGRARPAGQRRRCPHRRRPADPRPRPAGPRCRGGRPRADPPVPGRRDAGGARPRGAADAAGARPGAGRRCARPSPTAPSRSTAAPTATTYAGRCSRCPGIGPWTADYIALRALGHPDVFLPTDIGIRDALTGLGQDPARAADLAERWRPWRSYAQLHLWQTPRACRHRGELTCGP